jgi:molybdopterin molybdotransferase
MSPLLKERRHYFMLSVSEARERILAVFLPVDLQTVPLNRAAGRVLSSDIIAGIDFPLFDNSAMDGFALHKADLNSPRTLKVVLDIRAGDFTQTALRPGECARIMTGAPVPPGTEAVVMVEYTDINASLPDSPAPQTVTIKKSVRPGDNIRRRGEDLQSNEKVLTSGKRIRAQEIGLFATLGMTEIPVHRKPRLALLSSGDELIPVEAVLTSGKIHDSNSYVLAALAEEAGAELIRLGVAADTEADIRLRLNQAVEAKADLIVSSAGVSVGAFDFIKPVIEGDGELDFWKVNMRPGRPVAFGKYCGIPFIGLPGNPVSAFIGFEVFVIPALEKLSGLDDHSRFRQTAILTESLESDGRESYLRVVVSQENDRLVAHLTGHQGSGNIFSLVRANALLIVPSGVKSLPAGSEVEIWPIA